MNAGTVVPKEEIPKITWQNTSPGGELFSTLRTFVPILFALITSNCLRWICNIKGAKEVPASLRNGYKCTPAIVVLHIRIEAA